MGYVTYCGNCGYTGTDRIVWHHPTRQRLCPACLDKWIRRDDQRAGRRVASRQSVRAPIRTPAHHQPDTSLPAAPLSVER